MERYYCISCNEEVIATKEALFCDGCHKWQHRCGNTGISRQQYNDAVESGLEVVWQCLYCSEITGPLEESNRIEDEMMHLTGHLLVLVRIKKWVFLCFHCVKFQFLLVNLIFFVRLSESETLIIQFLGSFRNGPHS